jgi:hypothetical protein
MVTLMIGMQDSLLVLESSNKYRIHECLKGTDPQIILVKDDIDGSTATDPWALYIYAFKASTIFIDLRESGRGNNLSSISLIIQSS